MGLSHSRRRSSHSKLDTSHPGQARGSARKKRLKKDKVFRTRRQELTRANYAQNAQCAVQCHIIVDGLAHWSDAFKGMTVQMRQPYSDKYFGGNAAPYADFLRLDADLNKVSFEREVLGEFLSRGYMLESLEVQFDEGDRKAWGRCVWQKDHPSYHRQDGDTDERKLSPWAKSLLNAVFQTQYAGEQKFTLLSTQMYAMALLRQDPRILLHKTLIFRKAILSPPPSAKKAEAPLKKAA